MTARRIVGRRGAQEMCIGPDVKLEGLELMNKIFSTYSRERS